MKYKIILKAVILCCFIVLTSCSSDDDAMVAEDASSIVNKWYYDSNEVTADIYFNSNGIHLQRIEALGMTFESTGDWSWIDESTGLMKIDNLTGQVQLVSEIWFRFTNITENSFTLEQSTNGEDFFPAVNYQDTDPNG